MTVNGYPPGYTPPPPHAWAPPPAAHGGQPAYGGPAAAHGSAPPAYGAAPPAYGAAPPAYGAAPPAYGGPPAHGSAPPPAYGAPPPAGGFGAPAAHPYGPAPSPFGPALGYAPAYGRPASFGHAEQGALAGGPVTNGAPSLRWWILGSFVGAVVFMFLGGFVTGIADGDETGTAVGSMLTFIGIPLLITYAVTTLVWIYKSWEMLPPSLRVTNSGTHVSPGQAVGYLFIPFYNLYWYFVVSAGLAGALNRALAMHGSPRRASGGLAIAAAILQVIPYVNMLAPLLWIPFMLNVEGAKREYARVASGQPHLV